MYDYTVIIYTLIPPVVKLYIIEMWGTFFYFFLHFYILHHSKNIIFTLLTFRIFIHNTVSGRILPVRIYINI